MIDLDQSLLLGKGFHKACYQHPTDPDLCVKIVINQAIDATKQFKRELKHNLALQKRFGKKAVKGLSCYLGTVETNLGTGYLFELVLDDDGKVSKSLADYLENKEFVAYNYAQIQADLNILKQRLLDQSIIPMTIYPYNLLYRRKKEQEFELIIIDDIGTASFIPLEYYSKGFADSRIKRKWERFLKDIFNQNGKYN